MLFRTLSTSVAMTNGIKVCPFISTIPMFVVSVTKTNTIRLYTLIFHLYKLVVSISRCRSRSYTYCIRCVAAFLEWEVDTHIKFHIA